MEARHNKISRSHRRRGAVLVEAAFVIPILILMVFGMIELGSAIKDSLALNQIAREAARSYAVGKTPVILDLATNYGISSPNTVSVTNLVNPSTPGEQVKITLSYPHTPIVWGSTITLNSSMVMRRE